MASKKRTAQARRTLSDQHGIWCAWCLDYIEPETTFESHHVLGNKGGIDRVFGFEPWEVPVHPRTVRACHLKQLQPYADDAGTRLIRAAEGRADDLNELCRSEFFRGTLPVAFLLRNYLLQQDLNNPDQILLKESLRYTLIAAAGCKMGLLFVGQLSSPAFVEFLTADLDTQLWVASVYANHGDHGRAREICRALSSTLPRILAASSPAYAKKVRLSSYLEPSLRTSREALEIAKDATNVGDQLYHTRTSLLGHARAYEANRDYNGARDQAEELGTHFLLGRMSWWHFIEQQFLLGRTILLGQKTSTLTDSVDTGFKALIRAQYAAALLNFSGLPIPDFRSASATPDVGELPPTDAIRYFGFQLQMNKRRMTELRHEAIFGTHRTYNPDVLQALGWQESLLSDLTGKRVNR